jgi:hypothetical protein
MRALLQASARSDGQFRFAGQSSKITPLNMDGDFPGGMEWEPAPDIKRITGFPHTP